MKDKGAITATVITGSIVAVMIGIFVIGNGGAPAAKKVDSSQLTGLQETKAPWKPESSNLSQRLTALGLPSVGNESYHQHALIKVMVGGKPTDVPNGIGQFSGGMGSFHTHDGSGVVHIEAGQAYPFTLGQFFDVWGVKFAATQLGGYKNEGDKSVQVYVNGEKISDPASYKLKQKDKIVVGYGTIEQVPAANDAEFPKDL